MMYVDVYAVDYGEEGDSNCSLPKYWALIEVRAMSRSYLGSIDIPSIQYHRSSMI